LSVAKAVREGFGTAFYFSKDAFANRRFASREIFDFYTFYGVPISMFSDPKSKTSATKSSLKMLCAINEKQAIVHVMFLG